MKKNSKQHSISTNLKSYHAIFKNKVIEIKLNLNTTTIWPLDIYGKVIACTHCSFLPHTLSTVKQLIFLITLSQYLGHSFT